MSIKNHKVRVGQNIYYDNEGEQYLVFDSNEALIDVTRSYADAKNSLDRYNYTSKSEPLPPEDSWSIKAPFGLPDPNDWSVIREQPNCPDTEQVEQKEVPYRHPSITTYHNNVGSYNVHVEIDTDMMYPDLVDLLTDLTKEVMQLWYNG